MDREVELKAIQELVERGPEAYEEFLKAKGGLDCLSSDEKDLVRSPGFDFEALSGVRSEAARGQMLPESGAAHGQMLPSKGASWIYFSPPMNLPFTIQHVLIDMINSAQSVIMLAMYSFSDAYIFQALYTKAAANVSVNILLDNSNKRNFTNMLVNNKSQFPTKPHKMYIGMVTGCLGHRTGLAHEKFMTVDTKVAFTGSYNFSWAAANINRELAIITKAGPVTTRLNQQWDIMAQTKQPYEWPN